jgi:glycogen operon protein
LDSTASAKAPANNVEHHSSSSWFVDNVLHPAEKGSGLIQVYNTFASKPVNLPDVPEAKTKADWAVQTLSSAAGAILPYVAMGKLVGSGMRFACEESLTGAGARIVANDSIAQIAGAGIYDALKKPEEGETRWGNALGSMAGFTVFEGGNALLSGAEPAIARTSVRIATRFGGRAIIGAVGGAASYGLANAGAGLTGGENKFSVDGLERAAGTGAFLNAALPEVQKVAGKGLDLINQSSIGRGIPIGRMLNRLNMQNDAEMRELAHKNPLARVKPLRADGDDVADVRRNRVQLKNVDDQALLAHKLAHLSLAKEAEPQYKELAQEAQTNPSSAEGKFYQLRADLESKARQTENNARVRRDGSNAKLAVQDPAAIGDLIAGNGQSYKANWQQEWAQFKSDPSFRPRFEYADETVTAKAPQPDDQPAGKVIPFDKNAVGSPDVLGATVADDGINFAIATGGATNMELLIFPDVNAKQPSEVLPMYRTGDVFHRFVENRGSGTLYLYRASGTYTPDGDGTRFNATKVLLDPMASAVTGDIGNKGTDALGFDNSDPTNANRDRIASKIDNVETMARAVAYKSTFDWGKDKPLETPMEDTIAYELHVKGFTAKDGSLPIKVRGTYRGLMEKIPYLKQQGYTAVELMPIFKYDKNTAPSVFVDPVTGQKLGDAWGYNPLVFKAPEGRYAADGTLGQQIDEFKALVKAMHENGIEVYLDVVFNHTGEGGKTGSTINLKGLGNKQFYMLDPNNPGEYVDKSGCGNTLNANNPVTQRMILESLRYWRQEMHVDGFRFDLGAVFYIMEKDGKIVDYGNNDGNIDPVVKTPIIKAIEDDPVLSGAKLIAEPWGAAQANRLGKFSDRRWSEWNGNFRDTVRSFIKSDDGQTETLKDRIEGSPGWFDIRTGRYSINILTAHDGFTLYDLVSYNWKHNERDGEGGSSGESNNRSWNSGHEGPTDDATVNATRTRQMKNMYALLMLSRGVPQVTYGDEMRRTQNGNNNAWDHDDLINVEWDKLEDNQDMVRFTRMMHELRQDHKIGWSRPEDFYFLGSDSGNPHWQPSDHFIAWKLNSSQSGVKPLYAAFNAHWEPIKITLPEGKWVRLVDTNLPEGQDINASGNGTPLDREYWIQPRSAIVLEDAR